MNDRIKYLRKDILKMSQKDFGEQLNLSENFIWMIEKGNRAPSERTISDICRIFNVNPAWLRNGEEPKFMPEMDEDTEIINELLNAVDDDFIDFIRSVMMVYKELSPDSKLKLRQFAADLKSKIKESRD